ncbi:MAG TPA: hypothetical protein EYQ53_03955 [Candidatus Poseidoniales archaeon]|nr:MAG: hypothetical protein CXT69_01220 [Euryarchaeota archaeon]HIG03517.1 hypothetical protein [Candidatus Poseidoniales archaeon]HIK79077.1 hypothetical protein [Candidatus Poseidoniales archaeon]
MLDAFGGFMAGGGHAPAISLHDVATIIGAVLLLGSLSLMFIPVTHDAGAIEGENGEVQRNVRGELLSIDVAKGDSIRLEFKGTKCFPESTSCIDAKFSLVNEDGDAVQTFDDIFLAKGDENGVTFDIEEGGTYSIAYELDGELEWSIYLERRWMQPFLMPIIGAALLGWGVWQGMQHKRLEDESQEPPK